MTALTSPTTQLGVLAFAAAWVVGAELWRRRPGARTRGELRRADAEPSDPPRPPPAPLQLPPPTSSPPAPPPPAPVTATRQVVIPGWAVPDDVWVRVPEDLLPGLPPPAAPVPVPVGRPVRHEQRAEVVAAPGPEGAVAGAGPVQVPDSLPAWLFHPGPDVDAGAPPPPVGPASDGTPTTPDGPAGPVTPPAVAFSSRSAATRPGETQTAHGSSWLRRLVLGLLVGLVVGTLGSAAAWTSWALLTDSDLADVAALTSKDLVAPANVAATGGCNTLLLEPYVDLTWDAVSGADEYAILRRTGTNAFAEVIRVTTTSHRDDTVSGSTTYDYRIVTVEAGWESEQSATATASTPLCV